MLFCTRYAEEDPSILGSDTTPTEILAFCTGLLPAAAAAAARDTSELLKIAVEIVSITFRMAFEISRRMKLVEGTGDKWATTIIGFPLQKGQDTLDTFHRTQVPSFSYFYFIAKFHRTFLSREG